MKQLKSAVVFMVAMLGALPTTFAANSDITVTPVAVPSDVSVSRQCTGSVCTLKNFAAFEITIQNATTNVINQVVLSGSTAVTGVTPAQSAKFVESIPAGLCTSPNLDNQVTCNVGQLRGSTSFIVIFDSPPSGGVIAYDSTAKVTFTYSGTFSMQASPTSPPAQGGTFSDAPYANLITADATTLTKTLKTFVPSFGGTFFTGNNATALETVDPATTKLIIPAGLGLKKAATVDELVETGGLTNDTLTKNTHTISIPIAAGTFFSAPVTIELRRDASTVKNNQVDRAKVLYTSTLGETWQVSNFELPSCNDSSFYSPSAGPSTTWPVCIDSRTAFTKKTAVSPDDVGDWLIILKVLQNGRALW